MAAGLSQQVLADLINVTYQHVQSYEAGTTRITAARLYFITQALKVDMGAFFEGLAVPQRQALPLNSTCSSISPRIFGLSAMPSTGRRFAYS